MKLIFIVLFVIWMLALIIFLLAILYSTHACPKCGKKLKPVSIDNFGKIVYKCENCGLTTN